MSFALLLMFNIHSKAQYIDVTYNPNVSTVQVGQTFTVDVLVDFTAPGTFNAIDVFAQFNPLDLEVVSAPTPGSTLNTVLPGTAANFPALGTINSTGMISYSRFNIGDPGSYPTADLVYFSVTFRALRIPPGGTTALTFSTSPGTRTEVVNGATTLTINTPGATVNITAAGSCSGTLVNSGSCNGDFNLELTNTTGTGPFDLVINGTTYSNIAANTPFSVTPVAENFFGDGAPTANQQNDAAGVELGVRFNASQAGYITGLRFFAPVIVSGTYTGHLWSATGTLLATATFTGIVANDWNEVTFSSPVRISANTNYVASYYTSTGRYTAITFAFNSSYSNGGSLIIPAGGTPNGSGFSPTGNGVFDYNSTGTTTPVFPQGNYYNGNYFVDVIFVPESNSFALTSLSDDAACTVTGAPLQNLVVVSPDCSTLPVTLLNLSASPQDNKITLRWSTTSELNNTGFRIQRSVEAGNARWEDIGFVAGAGTTSATSNYSYVDNNLSPRRYYYRLMQIDIDGQAKFTPVVSATINGKGESLLEQNFPNPFRSETTTIRFTLPRTTQVMLSVFDMNGRLVKVLVNGKKDAGTHAIPFNAGSLGSGVYYYKIQAGDFTDVKKMTIQ